MTDRALLETSRWVGAILGQRISDELHTISMMGSRPQHKELQVSNDWEGSRHISPHRVKSHV